MEKVFNTISVGTIQTLYANSLSSTLDGQLLVLEGFYLDKKSKLYGKYYYDDIVSQNKQDRITSLISQSFKETLVDGKYYQFQGFVNRGKSLNNDSKLDVVFTVSKILKHEQNIQLIYKVEYDILQARFDHNYPLISDILLKKIESEQKPVLDVITGVQSTSKEDYLGQLPDYLYYEIRHHQCNLSSITDILDFISSYDFNDTDLLIILRGGGSGLEIFNEIELCKKAIELPIPFITGIGHDSDKTLLEKVADRGFSTPTAVGAFLQNTINTYKERVLSIKSKDEELVRFKKQAENEKLLLNNQIALQKQNIKIFWVVLLIIMVVLWFLINKVINM